MSAKSYQYQRNWIKQQAWEFKKKLVEEHGGKCKKCGGEFPQEAFDFDHEGPKLAEVGVLATAGKFDEAREEASRCQLLCANCHRVVTKERHLLEISIEMPPTLNVGDLIQIVWFDATEDSVGDITKASPAVRTTYALFVRFGESRGVPTLVTTYTSEEDHDTENSGWTCYPVGIIRTIKLIRRARSTRDRRRKREA